MVTQDHQGVIKTTMENLEYVAEELGSLSDRFNDIEGELQAKLTILREGNPTLESLREVLDFILPRLLEVSAKHGRKAITLQICITALINTVTLLVSWLTDHDAKFAELERKFAEQDALNAANKEKEAAHRPTAADGRCELRGGEEGPPTSCGREVLCGSR